MAQFHVSQEWLTAYATGAVGEAASALIAAHLTLCPECRTEVTELENLGGVLLDAINPDKTDAEQQFGRSISANARPQSPDTIVKDQRLFTGALAKIAPRPLLEFANRHCGSVDLESLPWRPYAPGVKRAVLSNGRSDLIARFVKAQPGSRFPHHDHGSDEMTIVLQGAYRDHTAVYSVGDVQSIGEDDPHQPVIEGDEVCVAFVISEKPPIPTNFIARLAQRVIG